VESDARNDRSSFHNQISQTLSFFHTNFCTLGQIRIALARASDDRVRKNGEKLRFCTSKSLLRAFDSTGSNFTDVE